MARLYKMYLLSELLSPVCVGEPFENVCFFALSRITRQEARELKDWGRVAVCFQPDPLQKASGMIVALKAQISKLKEALRFAPKSDLAVPKSLRLATGKLATSDLDRPKLPKVATLPLKQLVLEGCKSKLGFYKKPFPPSLLGFQPAKLAFLSAYRPLHKKPISRVSERSLLTRRATKDRSF